MKEEPCYLCSGKTDVLYNFRKNKNLYSLLECLECNFLRINPVPDQKIIDGLYRDLAISEAKLEKEVFSSNFLTYIKKKLIINPLIKNLRQHITFIGKPKLLDIGCSTGWITNVSKYEGFDASGLEANIFAAEYGREKYGIEIIDGYIEDLETDTKYDAVTMFHVLEHIADPQKMLEQTHELLNEKGKLLIVVPNAGSLGVELFKKNYNWNIPHHISFFSPLTIRDILTQSGFRVLNVKHLISPPLLFYSYNKFMRQRKKKGLFSFVIKNRILLNALFLPLSVIGKIMGKGEVIAVYGEKV